MVVAVTLLVVHHLDERVVIPREVLDRLALVILEGDGGTRAQQQLDALDVRRVVVALLSTLGVDKESLDDMKEKAATLVSTASGRRGSGPRLSISPVSLRSDSLRKKPQNERLTKRADDRSREEEMREIKASSKEHRNSGATAAIVL